MSGFILASNTRAGLSNRTVEDGNVSLAKKVYVHRLRIREHHREETHLFLTLIFH